MDRSAFEFIEHSQNVTLEGAISSDPYVLYYFSDFIDTDGNGCNDSIELYFSFLNYNISGDLLISLTVFNSTGNVTANVEEVLNVGNFYSFTEWRYLFSAPSVETFTLNFTVFDSSGIILTQNSKWTANCTVETFDATSFLNETREPIRVSSNLTEIAINTTATRTFVLSLPIMSMATVVLAFSGVTMMHTARRMKRND